MYAADERRSVVTIIRGFAVPVIGIETSLGLDGNLLSSQMGRRGLRWFDAHVCDFLIGFDYNTFVLPLNILN